MLLSNLDILATAPGGGARLRELILTLAVQGKLLPQDPADEPASELLKKIRAEKDRLIAEGKIKRDKALAEVADEEKPFELPLGWEWVRLGSLIELLSGQHLGPTEYVEGLAGGVPYLTGPAEFGAESPAPTRSTRERRAIAVQGDILITVKGSGVGKLNLVTQPEIAISRQLMAIRPIGMNYRFLKLVLQTMAVQFQLQSIGIAIPGIGRDDVALAVLALPPLAEQSRIVTRVEELMRLCDALEAKGRLEAAQHAQLVSTLLATLTDSATPEALAAHWQRLATHFDTLLDRPSSLDALEQTVLQLAVRGQLVPQDPADEPASVLLKHIRSEKDRLIATGQIKRDKPLEPITDDEKPFELPAGWEWARFGEVALISSGITLGRKTSIPSPVVLPYLRVANVQRWHLNLASIKEVAIDRSELERFQLADGDLLITEGGDWDKVGRTAIWRNELPVCLHQNHVFKVRGTSLDWNPVWAELYLNSAIARSYFASAAKQTTNLASINSTQLKNCVFPLPPLAEQARIVARVESLRRLCADLRQRLSASQTAQAQLAGALVREIS
ncbi:MAG: restriction endonuclease subunit S [Burkholderiaceae bacterium]|nr:restriction endonuclease subunit S [Burkholderiaceae bacterium]